MVLEHGDAFNNQREVLALELRLLEDPTPANTQVGDFLKALVEVDRRALALVIRQFVTAMLLVYSLFVRRDSATDSKDLHAMLEQARQAALKEILPPEVFAGVKDALENSGATLLHESETQCDVYAVVEETGEEIHGIKELARMCVQADPDTPWDVLADLCDKEFSRGVQPDRTQIALWLAYPDYKHRTLMLDTDEPEGEAEEPEGTGQPGPV